MTGRVPLAVLLLLAAGSPALGDDAPDPERGRTLFRACAFCHTLTPDGGNRAGPTLWGLFGRPAGAVEGYHYSPALKGSGIVWDEAAVARLFEIGPDVMTPGSKMPMQTIASAADRRDLVAYLKGATAR
ncbi:cytochrome c (plasmid) [Azospirillum sp. TSH58]|uniref:c-type cytochrome n=1 Tax=Azospirillum sp. TSH58 TaxID=664962 RepID=UPI000D5FF94E|nr:c-type cytochrome [Azospirillum sp. TSH58]AWJ87149.1 cytochrome c [Azospirillum sp. TSH58]